MRDAAAASAVSAAAERPAADCVTLDGGDSAVREPSVGQKSEDERIEVKCECTDPACRERVGLSPDELAFVRSVPSRVVVKIGHPHHLTERVLVEEPGRFQVIERLGAPEDVVAQRERRARGHRRHG
jgi:hypothetical protein